MGESFWNMGDWAQAITKYDEYEKYFPEHSNQKTAQYHRAFSLVKLGQNPIARFALKEILADPKHPYRLESLNLLATIESNSLAPQKAIAALQELLSMPSGSKLLKAKAHYQLAEIYFDMENWAQARQNYLSPYLKDLNHQKQYHSRLQSILCLQNNQKFLLAIKELKALASEKKYRFKKNQLNMLLAKLHWDAFDHTIAEEIFLDLAIENPKTLLSAEAWYHIAEIREELRRLPKALIAYKNISEQQPYSTWAKKAKPKIRDLEKLLKLQVLRDKKGLNNLDEFKLAELFLFKLNEVDTALTILDSLSKQTQDTLVQMKSTYAKAFIYETFKKDSLASRQAYMEIIEKYPNTKFAQQAEKNLGRPSQILTRSDSAQQSFIKSEALFAKLENSETLGPIEYDSLEAIAMASLDSVIHHYHGENAAIKGIYLKAWIFEKRHFDMDSAKVYYTKLMEQYRDTPWGEVAYNKIAGKSTITRESLDKEWKYFGDLKKREAEWEARKAKEVKKKIAEPKEELLWDFEDMYDVQK
jgi:TolA-binding protein